MTAGNREVQALLYQTNSPLFALDRVVLSEAVWQALGIDDRDAVPVRHASVLHSLAGVRCHIHGQRLDGLGLTAIVCDVVLGRFTDVQLSVCNSAWEMSFLRGKP